MSRISSKKSLLIKLSEIVITDYFTLPHEDFKWNSEEMSVLVSLIKDVKKEQEAE